ncbi:hypothetical protein [Streptomyces sp. NPDC059894]|uniref:hypothetical protein n=1 Tax=unclassified Streptomyces TaxID=2593676 RepID=UPI003667479B
MSNALYVIDGVLFLYAFMLARSREVAIHQVILICLAGFLLAMTPLADPLWALFMVITGGTVG